jgi:hypothetical protein
MQKEIWKYIPGYEDYYKVSTYGRVKSMSRLIIRSNGWPIPIKSKILKPIFNKHGYTVTTLCKDGVCSKYLTHTLVAMAFLKKDKEKYVIDHIDNNKSNNKLTNLQYISHRENCSKDVKNKTSKYRGVHWAKQRNKWRASIKHNGKCIYLGYFLDEYDAYLAYNKYLEDNNIY